MATYKASKMWTMDEFRTIKTLWDSKTFSEIRDQLGVNDNHLNYVVEQMRKEGVILPKKHSRGEIRSLIQKFKAMQ